MTEQQKTTEKSSETIPESLVEMKNIVVRKNDRLILDSLCFNIKKGENIALIGPNGSGKSSIIKTIIGDYRPIADTKGMVFRIMEKDRWVISDLKNLMGIVSGDLQLDYTRDISVVEVVLSGFFSSIGIYPNMKIEPYMLKRTADIIDFLEIRHLASKSMSHLSTGEARRVLIGRALVHDPMILVLDEPTNSLDLKSKHVFRETVSKVAAAGKSIILVTHDLEDIVPEINRAVLLKDGRIFADGDIEDILTAEKLTELFGIPVEVGKDKGYYHAWC
ncbi:ABC-type molybdenum transport system, ATPase component/photorepair protein PhrA [Methanolobus tindarius DSM 2278]|uniref:ABC-type molybdenum transport system, ATPase component/photorepair protein PhrA n=1 Tax=Methanolobus tindarius DSM 2278 TaxID=1090322 RepID=W9DV21_METTI|nr:ATP-binding cassette domain-containing protein [Methanolobus tindarius]ETA67522.1 ABC-type molybdenum transport system, ATPase component/photorepair protein PhrA [Methanolobus tindarius DSM 2278]